MAMHSSVSMGNGCLPVLLTGTLLQVMLSAGYYYKGQMLVSSVQTMLPSSEYIVANRQMKVFEFIHKLLFQYSSYDAMD